MELNPFFPTKKFLYSKCTDFSPFMFGRLSDEIFIVPKNTSLYSREKEKTYKTGEECILGLNAYSDDGKVVFDFGKQITNDGMICDQIRFVINKNKISEDACPYEKYYETHKDNFERLCKNSKHIRKEMKKTKSRNHHIFSVL